MTVWKTYVLSLVGNWVLQIYDGDCSTETSKKLDELLKALGSPRRGQHAGFDISTGSPIGLSGCRIPKAWG